MGIDYRLTSRFDKAEECYLEAMSIDPEDPELYVSLGALYIYKGEAETAIEHLRHAIEIDPQIPAAHANFALALAMTGDFEAAETQLKTAVAMGYENGKVIRDRIREFMKIQE
jgi:Flp pilus assembly protein TadD